MADSKLELLIDIRSRLDELTKASAEMAKFRQETTSAGQALKTGFGVDIARRGIELLTNSVREFALQAFQMADQIEDTSRNLGLSIEAYQVLARTVRDAGGDMSLLSMAVANSNRSLGEARQLGSAAAAAYRQLGLDVGKLESLPVERRFEAIAMAIANSEDQLSAYSAASQILGSRNLPTLLGALKDLAADGYDNVAKAAQRAGQVMEADTVRRLKEARKAIEDLKNATTIAVGGEIGTIMRAWQRDGFMGMLRYGAAFMSPFPRSAVLSDYAAPKEAAPAPVDDTKARAEEQQRRILALARANVENAAFTRQSLMSDPTLTDIDRRARLALALEREIALRRELASSTQDAPLDNEAQLDRDQRLFKIKEETLRLERELYALRTEGRVDAAVANFFEPLDRRTRIRDAQAGFSAFNDPNQNPNFMTPGQGVTVGAAEWVTELGSKGEQVASSLKATLGAAVSSISDGIYGWITGTMSFSDAMAQLGDTVFRTIIQTIVQMGVQWMVTQALIKAGMISTEAVGDSLRAARVVKENAAEAATLPAKTAGAAASGISSFGASLLFGALAVALIASLAGGFSSGGYTGDMGRGDVAGVVHGQEYVLNAAATQSLGVGFLDQVNRLGAIPAGAPIAPVSAGSPLLSAGGSSGSMMRDKPAQTFFVDSRSVVDRLRDDANFKVIVRDMITGDPGFFGLPS
jgi:hypothetical protein